MNRKQIYLVLVLLALVFNSNAKVNKKRKVESPDLESTNNRVTNSRTANNTEVDDYDDVSVANTPFRRSKDYSSLFVISDLNYIGIMGLAEGRIEKSDVSFGLDYSLQPTQTNDLSFTVNDKTIRTILTSEIGLRSAYHIPIVNEYFDPYLGGRVSYSLLNSHKYYDFILGTRIMFNKIGLAMEYHPVAKYAYWGVSFNW